MKTIKNIKKVSLILFIITGIVHIGSSAFIANEFMLKQAFIVNKIMDIPFAITGLIYALSSLRLTLTNPEKEHKKLDIIIIITIISALVALIAINLIFQDINR